jgi:predicted MFS family arabinose efflux permease
MGMAPMTMAPLAAWLISIHDWRSSMLIIAVLVAALMVPAALLVRRPPALEDGGAMMAAGEPQSDMTVRQAVRSPQFIILMLANFFCCATHSGPIFHTVSYAVTCGIPMIAAVSIYSIEGFSGMFGRIGFGVAGDRFGAQRVLAVGLLAQAFGVLAYAFVDRLDGFYAVAVVVGFLYAGTMPLYAVIIRENFPLRMMGTIIGGTAMAGSLGMSIGPLLGGLIYDRFGSYAPLYVCSWGMGLVAMLILMAFRPFPGRSGQMAVA